jgi:cell volume regulation protein A
MAPLESTLLVAAVLLILGVIASKASGRLGVPALLFFLVLGMLAGSEGPGGIYFDDAALAQSIGVVALAIILFAGGLDTNWATVRPVLYEGVALSTVGVLLTAVLIGQFATLFLDVSLLEGLLLGAIVSSTDAAAVFAVLRSRRVSLKGSTKALLELESGSNDPMAVFLTLAFTQLIVEPQASAGGQAGSFVLQMSLGAGFGFAFGRIMVWTTNRLQLEYEGLYPVLSLAMVLLCYAATAVAGGNGFLAVYVAGLTMGNHSFIHRNSLVRFHDGLAWLMQIAMFITLGLLVFPSRLLRVAGPGLLIVAFLMFVARPVSVILALLWGKFTWKETIMIGWVGLRGAVPIVLATFPLLARVPGADIIFDIVFFVVFASVAIQGPSIAWLARHLGLDAPFPLRRRYPIEFEQTEGVDTDLVEFIIPFSAAVAGRQIVEVPLPPGALIILICREEEFIVPHGSTVLEPGDVVLTLVNQSNVKEVQARLTELARPSRAAGDTGGAAVD